MPAHTALRLFIAIRARLWSIQRNIHPRAAARMRVCELPRLTHAEARLHTATLRFVTWFVGLGSLLWRGGAVAPLFRFVASYTCAFPLLSLRPPWRLEEAPGPPPRPDSRGFNCRSVTTENRNNRNSHSKQHKNVIWPSERGAAR